MNQFTRLTKFEGKVIGQLYGRKLIKSEEQVVLIPSMDGFGMSKVLIDRLITEGIVSLNQWSGKMRKFVSVLHDFDTIEIHYENIVYQASVRTFQEKGIPYQGSSGEAQYVLPRKYFIAVDSAQLTTI